MDRGCVGKGCSDSREIYGLPMGASVEGELHLSWMQIFPSPFMHFNLHFSKMLIKGHFPSLVTSSGNVSHKHFTRMRRLAHDETPFPFSMPLRDTTLVW